MERGRASWRGSFGRQRVRSQVQLGEKGGAERLDLTIEEGCF